LQQVAADLPRDEEGRVYDAMRVYARVMKFYGLSDERLDRMDYLRFFGLLREMRVYVEERQPASQPTEGFLGEWGEFEE
jgi:hypothetical protein